MIRGKRTVYENVLNIPEATVGEFAIRHMVKPAGAPVPTSNLRTALYRGQAQPSVVYDHETRWHSLTEGDGVWMTDYPIEQIQHDEELKGMRDSILIGGLGLGYAATALAQRRTVKRIVVVEKQPEVVALVAPHIAHPKITVVTADLFDYLKAGAEGQRFSYGFYDIWQSDGETTFHHVVMPLRQLSRGLVGSVTCWNEIVMRGQLLNGLHSRLLMLDHPQSSLTLEALTAGLEDDNTAAVYVNWAKPYWAWFAGAQPSQRVAMQKAAQFVKYYGRVDPEMLPHVLGS